MYVAQIFPATCNYHQIVVGTCTVYLLVNIFFFIAQDTCV